jgi:hypothetical protein
MSPLFATLLILHVITGVIGVIATYATLLIVLQKTIDPRKFFRTSFLAWASYITSWLTVGYYYWFYYGAVVKPVIKAGQYPWAHNIVMEAKEHIFLMLPVLSLVTVMIAWSSTECLNDDPKLKSAVVFFIATTCAIGTVVALAGILISGGAR